MRISFLCISFEPGKDGVGDYVRQFVRALRLRGHDCQVLALADRYVDVPVRARDLDEDIDLVRIPAAAWHRGDLQPAIDALERFAPDWVSLQMVSYGYEPRGMLWRSARRFASLRTAARRHVMFHELWIGEARGSSLRSRIVGWVQKRLLLRLVRLWSPILVHTSIPAFRQMLCRAGIVAEELGLPGNIPIIQCDPASARRALFERLQLGQEDTTRVLLAGVFGSVHPEFSRPEWLRRLAAAARDNARRLVIVHFGRADAAGQSDLVALREALHADVRIVELSEMPPEAVSLVMQGLDFGVATTPWLAIGKSGSVASMIEHGLAVVVPRTDVRLRTGLTAESAPDQLLFRTEEFSRLVSAGRIPRRTPQVRQDVYDRFAASLQQVRCGHPQRGVGQTQFSDTESPLGPG